MGFDETQNFKIEIKWEKRGDDGGYTQYIALVDGADVILNPQGALDHVDFKKGATVFTKDLDILFSIFDQVSRYK